MPSILLCSTPVHAHVTPLLPVISALVGAGHTVRVLTGERYRTTVEQGGARWLPLPAEADFDDQRIDELFPGRVGLTGPKAIQYDMREIFLRPLPAQAAALAAAIEAEPTDVVLAESLFTGILPLLTRPRSERPAVLNLGIVPVGLRSHDTAPFGLGLAPRPGTLGRLRNDALHLLARHVLFGSSQRYAQQRVREVVDVAFPDFFLNWMAHCDGILQFTVPGFEYPRSDVPVPVHFIGPLSTSAPTKQALPQWWSDLDGDRRVVLVTQGTVANADLADLIVPTLEGLAEHNVLVVATTGGPDVATLGELPANARAAEYLPYDELLPKVDVLVTNGGYGGVHFALRHGVPVVVAGMTEDKAEVAARVAWSGAGLNLRTNRPSPASVADAVQQVLAEPTCRAAARRLGAEIDAAPGVTGLLAVIDDLVSEPVTTR